MRLQVQRGGGEQPRYKPSPPVAKSATCIWLGDTHSQLYPRCVPPPRAPRPLPSSKSTTHRPECCRVMLGPLARRHCRRHRRGSQDKFDVLGLSYFSPKVPLFPRNSTL